MHVRVLYSNVDGGFYGILSIASSHNEFVIFRVKTVAVVRLCQHT